MPLFCCQKCGCIENTALGQYWTSEEKLCSECATGEWHDAFPKKSAIGMLVDQNGFLWSEEEVKAGELPTHYKIVDVIVRK